MHASSREDDVEAHICVRAARQESRTPIVYKNVRRSRRKGVR